MRRVFWVAVGAAAGVYAVRKVQKTMHSYSPSGVAERASGLGERLQALADDIKTAMSQRESELRDALGLSKAPELSPAAAADLIDHPTSPRAGAGLPSGSPRAGAGRPAGSNS